ncbi:hypothetical protein E4U17_005173 [Claviceps sp. LM77 group G4]|nr:hypothetical protein E4U17_005173 [Claviceps sp. LM77 group G4]KAG6062899.1 hypothetical protein E4U33_006447 [Claviceps sp. LM78 group G4]KAG6070400.1 hypothetical protein E4U16_006957 [Claviceps sp. LM84 group G4]
MEDTMAGLVSTQTLVILLTTIIPSALLITIATILYRARRRRAKLFARAVTPIDDQEILSWKMDRRESEKPFGVEAVEHTYHHNQQPRQDSFHTHKASGSVGSIQKPASVIIYHDLPRYTSRSSLSRDTSMMPPIIPNRGDSLDMPPIPVAVLARAPNSRPGLTDEAVQGEDAFIAQPRRQTVTARLPKSACPSRQWHERSNSAQTPTSPRTTTTGYGQTVDSALLPRRSAETLILDTNLGSGDVDSWFTAPRWGSWDEEVFLGGLSPRPVVHRSEIGRAIGRGTDSWPLFSNC